MSAPHADQLIEGYLARLRATAADLPGSAREELIADMRSHIAEARAREPEETDASILNILDRLGDPVVVAAEAGDGLHLKAQPSRRGGVVEIAAVVLLPFVWIAGVILLWWSQAWSLRDKIIGTVCSLGGYPFVMVLAIWSAHASADLTVGSPCDGTDQFMCGPSAAGYFAGHFLEVAIPLALLLLPAATSIYLVIRLRGLPTRQRAVA